MSKNATTDPAHPHHGIAKFNLFNKIVYHVGGTDEATIRAIATNKDLSFSQGNNFLFAGITGAKQNGLNDEGEMDAEEKKEMRELAKAISPARLTNMAPIMAEDAVTAFEEWIARSPKSSKSGGAALIDLQYTYYPLIFKYTVRMMGMAEYASSPEDLDKFIKAFWDTQMNAGFWTTLVPWLPQPRLVKRIRGAITLWTMVRSSLKDRIREGRREDDYAQTLIDRGVAPGSVSRFVIGGLIAGILNTIGTGAYVIAYVGADPELQKKCREEVEDVCRKSAEARGESYEELSNMQRLTGVKIEEWEAGCETLLLCFRESIRLLLTNSLNRYYPGPSKDAKGEQRAPRLKLYGHEIEDDCYVVFSPPSNLHDSDAFPDPFKFDPFRYKRGQGLTDYTFVGWGVGNHRESALANENNRVQALKLTFLTGCTGMRFAKLETLIAVASFVLCNDFVTVNDKDESYGPQEVPLPDLSQLHWRKPRKEMRIRINKAKSE